MNHRLHSPDVCHSKHRQTSRRGFLKCAAAISAVTALPAVRVSAMAGQATPNEKVNLACCGIGGQGGADLLAFVDTGLCNIVAVCDTDMDSAATKDVLKKFPNVPRFQDFRKMLDTMGGKIDAVTAGVPDHAHFPIAMMAMGLGKHIFVEKPLGHTFFENELMMLAEKKHKVATQMGNQGHSGPDYFIFKAWVEQGIVKNVTKIVSHMNSGRRWHKWNGEVAGLPPAQPIPATLDWDTWLSQVPLHAYNRDYALGDWRCWYDFGDGALGDWGAHIFNTVHQFLKLELPTEVRAVKLTGHNPYVFPMSSTLSFQFPARGDMPPVEMLWYDGIGNFPNLPDGMKNGVSFDKKTGAIKNLNAGKEIYADGLIFHGTTHGSPLSIVGGEKAKDVKLPKVETKSSDHYANFLLACKGQEKTRSPFSVSGLLSQTMTLGCIAQRLNAKLTFDPATKQITNDKLANGLLVGPPPRKGWEQYYTV